MLTKAQATELGREALSRIKNKQVWKLEVHENLGWHWTLSSCGGLFTLSGGYNGECDYSCLISDGAHIHCGSILWHDHARFKDPNQAIAHTLKLARSVVTTLHDRVILAESVCCKQKLKKGK